MSEILGQSGHAPPNLLSLSRAKSGQSAGLRFLGQRYSVIRCELHRFGIRFRLDAVKVRVGFAELIGVANDQKHQILLVAQ